MKADFDDGDEKDTWAIAWFLQDIKFLLNEQQQQKNEESII